MLDKLENRIKKIFTNIYIDSLINNEDAKSQIRFQSCNSAKILQEASKNWQTVIDNKETIVIAVSGGKDSMSLAIALQRLGASIIAVVVNHNLRDESLEESKRTEANLKSYMIKTHILHWKHSKITSGIEEKARNARYELLFGFCKLNNIKYLLTAHHLNDQVETILMNIARGTGIEGLSGIKSYTARNHKEVFLIRPMLKIKRAEIEDFIEKNSIPFVQDPTNANINITRNKLRNALLSITNNKNEIDYRISEMGEILLEESKLRKKHIDQETKKVILSNKSSNTLQTPSKFIISHYEYITKGYSVMTSIISTIIQNINNKKPSKENINNLFNKINSQENGLHYINKAEIEWGTDGIKIKPKKVIS